MHTGVHRVHTLPSADQSPMQSNRVLQHTHMWWHRWASASAGPHQCVSISGVRDTSCKLEITKALSERGFNVWGFFAFFSFLPGDTAGKWGQESNQPHMPVAYIPSPNTFADLCCICQHYSSSQLGILMKYQGAADRVEVGGVKQENRTERYWLLLSGYLLCKSFPLLFSQDLSFSMWVQTTNNNQNNYS